MIRVLLTAMLIGLCLTPCRAQERVVVIQVRQQSFPLEVQALGNARANEAIEIRPKITATVTGIHFEEGQAVQQGDRLVSLENTEPLADVAAARANLIDFQSQYKRAEELYRTKAVAQSQLEQLEAQRDAARAAVAAAEARLADTEIRAPFDGRVGLRRISVGSLVDSNTVITTLDDTRRIKVDFDVPETFLARLAPGLAVIARSVAYPEAAFHGEVASVDTRVDPVSRTVTVRAVLPNDDFKLRAGMFLTVNLLKQDVEALMIPEQALVPERSEQFVFVVDGEGRVQQREVQTGRRRPGQVEILEGLGEGERIIVEGTQKVRGGDVVATVEPTE